MRFLLCALLLFTLSSCEKKTDTELFSEGKTRVTLSASDNKGYEPLAVSFEAYLENKERVLTKDIREAKWIIKGPHNFVREVLQESNNYQDISENEADSFYLDYYFQNFGRYTVQLILNGGEYVSNPAVIRVLERERDARNR